MGGMRPQVGFPVTNTCRRSINQMLTDAKTQIIIVGLIALTCPGLFNALTGLGSAGGDSDQDTKTANAANAALYAFFAVFGYFGGAFFNLFGNRILLGCGGAAYCLYTLGIYLAWNVSGAKWVAVVAGALLGIGAGLFWTAQGAMIMAYSTAHNRGNYIGLFWILFNLGGVLGGVLQFGLNFMSYALGLDEDNRGANRANRASYFTFAGLMALGALSVPLLIVPPGKVKKADGSAVQFSKGTSAIDEMMGALKVVTNKYMILLTIYFISSNWFYTYQFNFVNGKLFNIRTRGMNSAFYWGAQMLAAYVMGVVVDYPSLTRRARGVAGWALSSTIFAIAWGFGVWLQYGFEGGYDKNNLPERPMDLTESRRCALPISIFVMYGLADAALQAFAYWIMGAVAGNDAPLAARFSGYYKGVQSAGAAVAWSLDMRIKYAPQFWIGFAFWSVGTLLAYVAVRDITNVEGGVVEYVKSISVLNSTGETAIQLQSHQSQSKLSTTRSHSKEPVAI